MMLDGIVCSPPLSPDQPCASQTRAKKDYHAFTRGDGTKRDHAMRSPGQIGRLPVGDLAAVLCSPPYAESIHEAGNKKIGEECPDWRCGQIHTSGYGSSPGQLGSLKPGDSPVTQATACPVEDWANCYDGSWKGVLCGAAFQHPAKMSRNLLQRILEFGFERGFWKKGDLLGDPFFGVGTLGILGAYKGLRVVGVELEPRFCTLAEESFALHRFRWGKLGCPAPVIVQGDSRRFAEVVGQASGLVTSPPYQETRVDSDTQRRAADPATRIQEVDKTVGYGTTPGQIGALPAGAVGGVVTSPPYSANEKHDYLINEEERTRERDLRRGFRQGAGCFRGSEGYGATEGQIGRLVSLPENVYTCSVCNSSIRSEQCHLVKIAECPSDEKAAGAKSATGTISGDPVCPSPKNTRRKSRRRTSASPKTSIGESCTETGPAETTAGGDSPGASSGGRLSNGTATSAATAGDRPTPSTTSRNGTKPGASGTTASTTSKASAVLATLKSTRDAAPICASCVPAVTAAIASRPASSTRSFAIERPAAPAPTPRSTDVGDYEASFRDYWSAVRQVYASCRTALRPGGVLCAVLKDYVKQGQRVPLCDQTAALLAALGFTVFLRCRCWLTKEEEHAGLFGAVKKSKSKKSFFRRLAERKGSPAVDWEEVLWARTPSSIPLSPPSLPCYP